MAKWWEEEKERRTPGQSGALETIPGASSITLYNKMTVELLFKKKHACLVELFWADPFWKKHLFIENGSMLSRNRLLAPHKEVINTKKSLVPRVSWSVMGLLLFGA